ncbi:MULTISPECIES: hypothetical protein [unclassified Streptomyces]|uniref:hypothetical protein n=1 Tax=unclassified Streptomyces TaxID=2593676 RepID=UPI002E2CEDD9|nr:hypothetical protein [Streptomyces sp. NBC_01439]
MFGITPGQCTNFEEQLTDLDTGQSRIVVPQNVTRPTEVEAGGAELLYWNESCDYHLRAMPQATVGILRKSTPQSFASCKAAANTGLGPVNMTRIADREARGIVVGASLCSVTDRGAIAMAVIEHIAASNGGDPTVTGTLYVWSKTT